MRLLLTQYAGGQHDIQTEPEDKVNRDAHHDGDHREQDDPFDAPLLFGRQDSDLCKQVHDGAEEEARLAWRRSSAAMVASTRRYSGFSSSAPSFGWKLRMVRNPARI